MQLDLSDSSQQVIDWLVILFILFVVRAAAIKQEVMITSSALIYGSHTYGESCGNMRKKSMIQDVSAE